MLRLRLRPGQRADGRASAPLVTLRRRRRLGGRRPGRPRPAGGLLGEPCFALAPPRAPGATCSIPAGSDSRLGPPGAALPPQDVMATLAQLRAHGVADALRRHAPAGAPTGGVRRWGVQRPPAAPHRACSATGAGAQQRRTRRARSPKRSPPGWPRPSSAAAGQPAVGDRRAGAPCAGGAVSGLVDQAENDEPQPQVATQKMTTRNRRSSWRSDS